MAFTVRVAQAVALQNVLVDPVVATPGTERLLEAASGDQKKAPGGLQPGALEMARAAKGTGYRRKPTTRSPAQ